MRRFLEWSFVGAVCLFVISLILPNFISGGEKNRDASVRSNIHTFQTILETYSVDSNGFYPKNVEELHKFASTGKNEYWKDFKSPYANKSGKGISYDDFATVNKKTNISNWIFFTTENIVLEGKMGIIYYDPIFNKEGQVSKYFIYGANGKNKIFVDSQTNQPFVLTNN